MKFTEYRVWSTFEPFKVVVQVGNWLNGSGRFTWGNINIKMDLKSKVIHTVSGKGFMAVRKVIWKLNPRKILSM